MGTPNPGRLLRDLERPNTLPPSSPELILDDEQIPRQAYDVMTSVMPQFAAARMVDGTYTRSIPEAVELLPDVERTVWSDDARLPS